MKGENETRGKEGDVSEAELVLGNMPEFSQRNNIINRINSINAEFIDSKMDVSLVKEYLCKVNGVINGVDQSEIVDSGEVVGVGFGGADLVASNRMIRGEIADNYVVSINNESDVNKKAELAYYAIINMHLFHDGNGRTARAVYLSLKNGKIDDGDDVYLQHGKDERGSDVFENNNSIESPQIINARATAETLSSEIEKNKLPEWLDGFVKENGPFSIHTFAQPEQEELVNLGLEEDEGRVLRDIFDDNYLAGYATAELLFEENTAEDVFEKNLVDPVPGICDYKRLTFTHLKNKSEKYNSVFGIMTAERYRRLISIYNDIKIEQNKKVIEIVQSK